MRSRPFILVALTLVLFGGGAFAAYLYDDGRKDTIAKGVAVAGVDVGGLDAEAAIRRLEARYLSGLNRPVRVSWRGQRFVLTPKQARLSTNLRATVDEALARSREGNVLTRTARGLTGGSVEAEIRPEVDYSRAAVDKLIDRVGKAVDRKPQDADVTFASTGPSVTEGKPGRRLKRAALRRAVEVALLDRTGSRRVRARSLALKPATSTAAVAAKYPTVLVVDRANFQLKLYKDLSLTKTYTVAIGQVGFDTPTGLYSIQNKAVDPVWTVPNSSWAGDLAGKVIPPGPRNPLKERWLGIYDGAGIHGTDQVATLGTRASHGCVRMAIPDVIELYDQVEVGAPIYIA